MYVHGCDIKLVDTYLEKGFIGRILKGISIKKFAETRGFSKSTKLAARKASPESCGYVSENSNPTYSMMDII